MDPLADENSMSDRERIDAAKAKATASEEEAEATRASASEGLKARRSIAQRAEDGDGADVHELFPMGTLPGDDVTPQSYMKKGSKATVQASLTKAAVPMPRGGLFDPNRRGRCLVTFLPGALNEQPERDKDGQNVVGWVVTQTLRVVHVEHANDEAKLIKSEFENLLQLDQEAAGTVLDELKAMFDEAMASDGGDS